LDAFVESLRLDLNKPRQESITAEIDNTISDALKAAAALASWTKPHRPSVDAVNLLDGCQIQSQPYGTALIIGAWNYPVLLVFKPLVGAIAAGNTAVVKPSEVSSHTAALITLLLPKYLDAKAYHVVNGGVKETTEILAQPFDFIMYTGNGQVGRVVAAAAAKTLTPICLELGGKSPVVVDADVDVALTARRVVWGRCLNAGQTCIAADYVRACGLDTRAKCDILTCCAGPLPPQSG
jgi:acyl-CoA reductase-like NAD-dependent aldehyde dehydrogenase